MTPLIAEALKSLTIRVNVSTGLLHPSDESAAKELFQMLRKESERLDAIEIAAWAVEHKWPEKHAKTLGQLAENIDQGGRVVIKHKGQWKPDIIKLLKIRAGVK